MRLIAFISILLLLTMPALAGTGTITIYGTNISNAQSNATVTGTNNTITVVQWTPGDTTHSFKINVINGSDTLTFVMGNFTVGRVIEVKANGTAFNAYQADSNGEITFTRIQARSNQTYSLTPAVQASGYNFTWMQLWTYPSLFGLNFTRYFLPNDSKPIPNESIPLSALNVTNTLVSHNNSGTKTNYTMMQVRIETGIASGDTAADVPVAFVSPFSTILAVTCSPAYGGAGAAFFCDVNDPTTAGFEFSIRNTAGTRQGAQGNWIAIGLR